ncbi:hypothetical protein DPSP01_014146 [Paraphaeosphaeria sporulosa]
MRLLYTTSGGRLECTDDLIDDEIPAYAILSHTWDGQEVVFKDFKNHNYTEGIDTKLKRAYQKLFFCAQQAKRDGLNHFWVDTCCIDKSNNTELSEAINSMYRWYQNAANCYAYLSDVEQDTLDGDAESAFRRSRWFTRGWTLQELLAPKSVEFFSSEGRRLGDKNSLRHIIHGITGIPVEALQGSRLSQYTVAERLSWAEKRQTTRVEDSAYCLLGMFDCHLPLIYGEGRERALKRLKREIEETGDRLGKICDWLSAPEPSTNYEKAHRQRQAETGLWLIEGEQFRRWKANAASRLWLYGIPGCGKTILTSTVIKNLLQHCGDDTSMVTAYFYFDFNDTRKQDPELMLRSLLCQLLQRAVTIPKGIDALFTSSQNGMRQPSPHALLEVMRLTLQEFTQVYIVLDALDECTLRSELMNMLEAVARWELDNLHLLMASRKERDIERSLETFVTEHDTLCLQRDIVDEDIQRYVRQRLCDDRDLVKWNKDAAIKEEIEVALMRGARGMFRWAVCQLDTLGKCRNRTMLRKSLTTLPKTLDQTYDRILSTISEEDSEYAIRILQWLTCSARPLSVEEIAEVAAIDVARDPAFDHDEVLEDPLEALNICSSLVTITANNAQENSRPTQKTVALAHYSVQEYLVSNRIKQGIARQYSMQECETAITKGCLKYLTRFQQPLSREIAEASALARYAAEFWSTHLRKTGEEMAELNDLAMDLMSVENPAYLAWIQLYDPDHPYYGGPDLSKDLKSVAAPLYYAALLGLSTITQILVGQGAEVNAQGGGCGNALHAASIGGHGEVVQALIKAGADINAQSGDSGNALQAASSEGHTSVVKILLDSNADVNAQGGRYSNALQAASAADQQAVVRLLLAYGANIHAQGGLYDNALNAAAAESRTATVELLLEKGANVMQIDVQRRSVLHYAINSAFCTTSLVKVLLSRGAPLDTVDIENMTPLHYSVKFGHQSIAELLLDGGVPIDAGVYRKTWDCHTGNTAGSYRRTTPEDICGLRCTSAGLTPLHFAALTGNPVMTEFLLKRGADPNAVSEHGETPLHLTLRKSLHGSKYRDDWMDPSWRAERLWDLLDFEEDDVEAVSADIDKNRKGVLNALLADSRTSLTVKDCQNEHVLHCVEYGAPGSASVVQRLIRRGAVPLEDNRKQQNALHFASRAGDYDAVVFLLSLGIEPRLTDSDGLNALHHASRSGNHETIAILLDLAVPIRLSLVGSKDNCGRNSLHHLLSSDYNIQVETTHLLLDNGVNGSESDASGYSPLASYIESHWLVVDIDICQLLLSVEGNSLFVDKDGKNLGHLYVSTLDCRVQVLEMLNRNGVSLTKKDRQSRTILHYAAISGSLTEQSLHYLRHVVSVKTSAEDASGKTALQYAAEMSSRRHDPKMYDPGRWDRTASLLRSVAGQDLGRQ